MWRFPFLGLASQVALFLGQLLKGSVEGGFCGMIGLRDSPAGDKRFSRCAMGKTSDAPDHCVLSCWWCEFSKDSKVRRLKQGINDMFQNVPDQLVFSLFFLIIFIFLNLNMSFILLHLVYLSLWVIRLRLLPSPPLPSSLPLSFFPFIFLGLVVVDRYDLVALPLFRSCSSDNAQDNHADVDFLHLKEWYLTAHSWHPRVREGLPPPPFFKIEVHLTL